MNCLKLIEELELAPLPEEGGWFRRTYTGEADVAGRPSTTSIHALFTREQFSAMHRLDADEVFFWHQGDPFEMLVLYPDGRGEKRVLGPAGDGGYEPMIRFERGCWFGGIPEEGAAAGFTLISCVVTPGFDWDGFELGGRKRLVAEYPKHKDMCEKLTRGE